MKQTKCLNAKCCLQLKLCYIRVSYLLNGPDTFHLMLIGELYVKNYVKKIIYIFRLYIYYIKLNISRV